MEGEIITWALAAATVVKVLVDLIKMAVSPANYVVAGMAILGGIGAVALLMVSGGIEYSPQAASQAVLAGILAAGSAVLGTELQNRASSVRTGGGQ